MTGAGAPARSRWRQGWIAVLAVLLTALTLVEVNLPHLTPQGQLAAFAGLGLLLCFLSSAPRRSRLAGALDIALGTAAVACCGYVMVQDEPLFSALWSHGSSLGNRAGAETGLDILVGVAGVLLVLEAARRSLGWALPILASCFLIYAAAGPSLPVWLLPHRGYPLARVVSQTFLHSQGVFGIALRVMFAYVFLFTVFGALLEATGATGWIIQSCRRWFRKSPGGPAKVAVVSSGLMGSLSGSAVANTATTGTFTIPLMRSAGFSPHVAAGVEAAASSGGALMPPVMGAGAYMMLEIIDPPVSYLAIVRAALIPALLYYLTIFLAVHFRALLRGAAAEGGNVEAPSSRFEGVVLVGALASLLGCLFAGYTVFRSVTVAIVATLALAALSPRTRPGPRRLLTAVIGAARSGVPLITAAAAVGIVIGVVTLTGIGTRLPSLLLPLAENSLPLALLALMASSLILGMGLPSAVCYLLLATLVGPVLGALGVAPLAAHLFIFYFGMMSMVTPPVALAAYAASSIAGCGFMAAGVAAFRFALAGFALPFLFVYHPELLMLAKDGGTASFGAIALATASAAIGVVPLSAAIAGYLRRPLSASQRAALFVAAALILLPLDGIGASPLGPVSIAGVVLFALIAWHSGRPRPATAAPVG